MENSKVQGMPVNWKSDIYYSEIHSFLDVSSQFSFNEQTAEDVRIFHERLIPHLCIRVLNRISQLLVLTV